MKEDDVDIVVEQDSDGYWIARALHRSTGTIKISDLFPEKDQAVEDAANGLLELVVERMKGLGEKK